MPYFYYYSLKFCCYYSCKFKKFDWLASDFYNYFEDSNKFCEFYKFNNNYRSNSTSDYYYIYFCCCGCYCYCGDGGGGCCCLQVIGIYSIFFG